MVPRDSASAARLRAIEKQIQNDTVEPADDLPPPAAAAGGVPADTNPTATTAKPVAPKKPARPAAPAAAPARQGAAQSITTPPVIQR